MTFQILALSGGGYLGLFTAYILTQLEQEAGRPLGQCFDLVAGTSIGGIIALGLAKEVPAKEIQDLFAARGKFIFSERARPKSTLGIFRDMLRFTGKPKYDGMELRRAVESILGENTILGDAKHRVLIPTVNMTKGSVQMFKTAHHPTFVRDHRMKMADVALATSAAPTYFPLAEVGDSLFADGGLFANAPDMCALHEAVHFLGQKSEDVRILSIGTTTARFSLSHATGRMLGAYHWLRGARLISTMISAQQQMTDFMLSHQLGIRYFRIDAPQSREQEADLALDVATHDAQKTIRGLADGAYQNVAADPHLKEFLHHEPEPPVFHG